METTTHGLKTVHSGNVRLVFLPPNTTSHVQPLDAGIIRAFKAKYRALHVSWLVSELEADESKGADKIRADIQKALRWSRQAWDNISVNTIRNCWAAAKIIDQSPPEMTDSMALLEDALQYLSMHVAGGEDALPTATDLVSIPAEDTTETTVDAHQLQQEHTDATSDGNAASPGMDIDNSGDEDDGCDASPPQPPNLVEAREHAERLLHYVEANSPALAHFRENLTSLIASLQWRRVPQKQLKLTDIISTEQ